jgi:hypothetical protein
VVRSSVLARRLPRRFRRFFWDLAPDEPLSWPTDREMVTARLLAAGDLPAIRWLRRQLGDDGLRDWIVRTRARGLSPRQIAYWSAVLGLEPSITRALAERAQGPGSIW